MNEKVLFTPGPLTTSRPVKEAMLRDLGSRDQQFLDIVRSIRRRLLAIAQVESGYEAVLIQGSGTFGIESVVGSAVPRDGHLLVLVNGAYGRRMVQIAQVLGIRTTSVTIPEDQPVTAIHARQALAAHPGVSHLGIIHCETTTGILNDVEAIGAEAQTYGARYLVDAMSSFGGIPLSVRAWHADFVVSSANKCIQGVPGFSFAIVRRPALDECAGRARSLSLDLHAQWRGLEADGQFRFTPPTHALLAFHQALDELDSEGGVEGRARRYHDNHETLMAGMSALGFHPYLPPMHQSDIITSFRYPADPQFHFEAFYAALSARGFVIYPGKLTTADCFRIGTIGHMTPADVSGLLAAIPQVLAEMNVVSSAPALSEGARS